jgi:hypothetical protein
MALKDQILCVKSEVERRKRIYPGLISAGKMTKCYADFQIKQMKGVYRSLVQIQDIQGPLES